MRPSTSVTSAVSLLILALPHAYAAPPSCNANPTVASCLSSGTLGTAYCSSVLKVPASTTYTTSTVTPTSSTVYRTRTLNPPVTTTVTSTSTVYVSEAPSTSTTTVTEIVIESSTTTTTTTPSCLTAGSTQTVVAAKRQAGSTNSCFPSGYPSSSISSACACLSIPTSTSTVSKTVTVKQGTVYSDSFTRPTVTSTNTRYNTMTVTPTVTVPTTTTTTTTSTVTATTTSLIANGVYVQKYSFGFDEFTYRPHFPSDDLKAMTPEFSDTLADPNFYTNSGYLTFPKQGRVGFFNSALVMQGYFIVPTTGTYTFYTDRKSVDNWQVVWIGDVAKQWINSQKSYDASRTTDDENVYAGGTITIGLVAGSAIPITIVTANGGGPAYSPVFWTSPDGTTSFTLRNNVIQSCAAF